MSRRRAEYGQQLEETLPAPSTTSSKARVTGARFGRFIRARPVAALFTFAAIISFIALVSAVGYTLLSSMSPSASSFSSAAHHDETFVTVQKDEVIQPDEAQRLNETETMEQCVREIPAGRFGANHTTCVTNDYFIELAIGDKHIGRVTIGVFGEAVPKSAANFRALVTCSTPFDNDRCYKGDSFHRIVPGFVIQGGSKATGHSIYGGTFREEVTPKHHSVLSHSEAGVLAYAEYPIGSQFYIILGKEARYLDGNHVVFGYVVEGMDVVRKVEHTKLDGEKPIERVSIVDCGEVKQ